MADLPVAAAGCVLDRVDPGPVHALMPYPGQAAALGRALGHAFPQPGRVSGPMIWAGREMAFWHGAPPGGVAALAAVSDVTDGWAVLRLSGARGPEVLARLVPVDLRATAFVEGRVARSLLGHMTALIHRTGAEAVEIRVMRSMAGTAAHEIGQAMRLLEARG